jgi:octaheme c-type cytochrome (tetrathionate reductase family)
MKKHLLAVLALALACASQALGGTHAFISGPFNSGPEVTKTCRGCHEAETKTFLKTIHWTWSKKQSVNGKAMEYGKKNALGNSFCFSLPSNWPACTSCHAGYGWSEAAFDYNKAENVDCLICHDTTGTYKKIPSGAGHPVYPGENKEFPPGQAWAPVDLAKVARSVDRPTRAACGNCHFYGGGGDGVKHGDLDSSLANPSPEIDVHMGKHKLTCESCHQAANHDVKGEAISVSPGSGPRAMACTNCHRKDVHRSAALNMHVKRIACQTCHIPIFAKGVPTVMSWDWSSAGKEVKQEEAPKDAKDGKEAKPGEAKKEPFKEKQYDKMKGDLVLAQNVAPTLFWYNGSTQRLMIGDKIDPTQVVQLSAPRGDRKDPDSRIFPFKVMKGRQPYDTQNKTMALVNLYGPADSESAYWVKFDWNKAIEAGMKAAGQPYSGKYGWVDTTMVWSLNHMVAPKEKALRCPDCHIENGKIPWKALGYQKDPRG